MTIRRAPCPRIGMFAFACFGRFPLQAYVRAVTRAIIFFSEKTLSGACSLSRCCIWPVCCRFARLSSSSRSDLPEVRKLCGVSGCPDCMRDPDYVRPDPPVPTPEDYEPPPIPTIARTGHATAQVIQDALDIILNHGIGLGVKKLTRASLVRTHLEMDCPILSFRHFSPLSFPGDRLHLAYVSPCCPMMFIRTVI